MQQNNLWNDVLKRLEKRINRPSFNTWLRPTSLLAITDQNVQIGVPDDVFVYWLGEHYVHVITEILTDLLGIQPEISFVVMEHDENIGHLTPSESIVNPFPQEQSELQQTTFHFVPPPPRAAPLPVKESAPRVLAEALQTIPLVRQSTLPVQTLPEKRPSIGHVTIKEREHGEPGINPRYTFDSFVVGNSNRFAHAAALAVADQMAVNYNPLFIYGGVGLGKTHLLHAIGNHVAALRPTTRILYLSSEQFINDFIASIREDRNASFRNKYRSIDLLLIDDIQFIARKERTQEEFFHTFNTLYHDRKQIVLTSDCPPKKIPTIAEQLRSRFEWGLIADIQQPDLETRVAILKKKAENHRIHLPDDIALYIATQVKTSIRELEGCLSKFNAYTSLNGQAPTLESTRNMLHDVFDATPKKITIELVQQAVARHYQVALDALKAHGRSREVSLPRQVAMYLSRELTNLSLPDIGRSFGGRDHTTVLYACKQIEKLQANDAAVKKSVMQLRNLIQT